MKHDDLARTTAPVAVTRFKGADMKTAWPQICLVRREGRPLERRTASTNHRCPFHGAARRVVPSRRIRSHGPWRIGDVGIKGTGATSSGAWPMRAGRARDSDRASRRRGGSERCCSVARRAMARVPGVRRIGGHQHDLVINVTSQPRPRPCVARVAPGSTAARSEPPSTPLVQVESFAAHRSRATEIRSLK